MEIDLGKEVYLTDTCYGTSVWCSQLLKNVKVGKWEVDYNYCKDVGKESVILTLANKECGFDIFGNYDSIEESYELGVDSGTLGVFDREYYEKYHNENEVEESWYEKNICSSNFERKAYITDNRGVWCNTAYGDGSYFADLYIKNGEVCGIKIAM